MNTTREDLARRWAPTLHRTVKVISEPVPEAEAQPAEPEVARGGHGLDGAMGGGAFVADVGGKTLLNAPASLFAKPEWSNGLTPNPGMLWMQGRFVGAEEPNRNNAMWATGDLELGEATVAHGPLNWLHESRHIIGTIADARLVRPEPAAEGAETAAENPNPHIVAASAVWKWIYPDEAWVIEQANDTGYLWYSMECISEHVECSGADGCGRQVTYLDYLQKAGCEHMQERSAVRRFINPVFLGGAVIVPPSRPGWADADARVLPEAAKLAEKAYEDAKRPDMPAHVWEQLVNQVVTYGKGNS
jgi:hypothetical protein